MTRGTFYLILPNTVYESTEFNGDMYPEGHGDVAYKMLHKVRLLKEFKKMIHRFNEENHGYEEEQLVHKFPMHMFENNGTIDFYKDYFDRFFSDWIFVKNSSGKPVQFVDRVNNKYLMNNGDTVRLNFGMYYKEEN